MKEGQAPLRVADPTVATPSVVEPLARRRGPDAESVEGWADPSDSLSMVHDPRDPRCTRLRSLRNELLLRRGSADRGHIVPLLSPCAGEGRSQLAAELAIAFAQTGRPTLLVDADLRGPRQHALFSIPNGPGLAEAIESGQRPALHAVRGLPRLFLLTAGEAPDDPLLMLSSRRFEMLLEEWSDTFEHVVIDTAPAAPFGDGIAVAAAAGRALVLSRTRHTPMHDLQDLLANLGAARSQVVGAVISHF